jgi:2-hydroxy-6-oxonona-2,4-dienedioate hydrolase
VAISRRLLVALALLVAAATIAVYVSYRRDLAGARQRLDGASSLVATTCGAIEYAAVGGGSPVLFVHGAGGGFDQGIAFGTPLAERGFRVLAMSRFGYLRTPLPTDASAAAQADAHACLLDALGIDRAVVVAGSAGAPSGLQLALRHPQRVAGLVLLVPATYVPRPGEAMSVSVPPGTRFLFDTALRSDFMFWAALRLAKGTLIRALLATPVDVVAAATPQERARVAAILAGILPVSERRLGLLNDGAITAGIERYPLERIAVPTLTLSVADDLFGTYDAARYTAEQIPGARFVGYPHGGHVWVGVQQELFNEIAAFAERAMPAGGRLGDDG